jgi:hypothetical protein
MQSSVVSRRSSAKAACGRQLIGGGQTIFAGIDRPAVNCLVYSMTVQLSAISQRPSANS